MLDDIWTCADLLRDINRSQELHAHDRELIREPLRDSARNPSEWLEDLGRLSGLDDTLDGVITQAQSPGANAGLEQVMDAVVRLSFLV